MDVLFKIFILFCLILCNAFFSMSELAIITLNDNKIKKMAQEGHKKAKKIIKLTNDSSSFLATIQVGVTFAGFLSSASAAQSFSAYLEDWFSSFLPGSIPPSAIATASTIIITLILSYFSLVLGELVPKKIAMQKSQQVAFSTVGVLSVTNLFLRPFVKLLSISTNAVIRLFGLNPEGNEKTVTEEEILMLVDVGGQKGIIEENEREMIVNIFEFGDTEASEIMTHRTEVTAVEDTQSIEDIIAIVQEEGYSRIPVYHDDLDTILGILYVKDLLKYVVGQVPQDFKVTDIMRPAYFVPECKRLSDLFSEMSEKKLSLAVVVDEYGGTSGIISMEDLLESIVGNIQDEFDDEEEEISRVSENSFTVEGSALLDEINDELGIKLPEGDYDTVAGFMVSRLGRIPDEDENPSVEIGSITLTAQQIEDRRISKILIVKNTVPQ